MRIRQRSKQDGIDHAEDRSVRADAEREGDHRDAGKRRILQELSESKAEIVHVLLRPQCLNGIDSHGASRR
jgi:hypothetical protein